MRGLLILVMSKAVIYFLTFSSINDRQMADKHRQAWRCCFICLTRHHLAVTNNSFGRVELILVFLTLSVFKKDYRLLAKTMQERLYGLKKNLCFEFALCFLLPSKREKKRGKFKTKNVFGPQSLSYAVLALRMQKSTICKVF